MAGQNHLHLPSTVTKPEIQASISQDIYKAVYTWIGHLRGGLAMATILACSGFAAVCGSSLATGATMGKVAIPEMDKYVYDQRLSTGCVAAGGTLGILIPPASDL